MSAWQFQQMQYEADRRGLTQFISMQNHYNLIYREEEREMIPYCVSEGVGIIPWSPLARGVLCGSFTRPKEAPSAKNNNDPSTGTTARSKIDEMSWKWYFNTSLGVPVDNNFDIYDRVVEIAQKKNATRGSDSIAVTPAQVSLSWMLHKPYVVSPIVGTTSIKHLDDAVAALGVELSIEEVKYLEELYKPHPISGYVPSPFPTYAKIS